MKRSNWTQLGTKTDVQVKMTGYNTYILEPKELNTPTITAFINTELSKLNKLRPEPSQRAKVELLHTVLEKWLEERKT